MRKEIIVLNVRPRVLKRTRMSWSIKMRIYATKFLHCMYWFIARSQSLGDDEKNVFVNENM